MYQKKLDILKVEKISTKKWVKKLFKNLINNYEFGNYNFDVLKIIGQYNKDNNFVFRGDTQNVIIYDVLNTDENYELGCRASHFIIESEGIVYLEVYVWWDTENKMHIINIKEIHSALSRYFKLIAFQIINGNYNEK